MSCPGDFVRVYFSESVSKCFKMSHVSSLAVRVFGVLWVKRQILGKKFTNNRESFFTFFLKADIEDQYMHLDSFLMPFLMETITKNYNSIEKKVLIFAVPFLCILFWFWFMLSAIMKVFVTFRIATYFERNLHLFQVELAIYYARFFVSFVFFLSIPYQRTGLLLKEDIFSSILP